MVGVLASVGSVILLTLLRTSFITSFVTAFDLRATAILEIPRDEFEVILSIPLISLISL